MTDAFQSHSANLATPGENAFAVTPNDSADMDFVTRAIYVGVAGNVKMTLLGGTTVTFVGLVAGGLYPLRVKRIWSTGTTASNLIGVY